jgi:hypothetical protein
MTEFNSMLEKEKVKDVISFFAGLTNGIGYPQMDNFFVR